MLQHTDDFTPIDKMQAIIADRDVGQRIENSLYIFENVTNPLSLGHRAAITFDNNQFMSVHHLVLYFKAHQFGDTRARSAILSTSDPQTLASIRINKFDINMWKRVEIVAHRTAIQIKLSECAQARTLLKSTGSKRLVYASTQDAFYGCGLSIDSENVIYPQFWQGQNVLGKILGRIRDH